MKTTIESIEEKLTVDAITKLANIMAKAADEYAKAFAPYMGYNIGNENEYKLRAHRFNEEFGKIVSASVALRMRYYAGYSTTLDVAHADGMVKVMRDFLPDEVIHAIRSVESIAFMEKVEAIGELAENTSQALDNIQQG